MLFFSVLPHASSLIIALPPQVLSCLCVLHCILPFSSSSCESQRLLCEEALIPSMILGCNEKIENAHNFERDDAV